MFISFRLGVFYSKPRVLCGESVPRARLWSLGEREQIQQWQRRAAFQVTWGFLSAAVLHLNVWIWIGMKIRVFDWNCGCDVNFHLLLFLYVMQMKFISNQSESQCCEQCTGAGEEQVSFPASHCQSWRVSPCPGPDLSAQSRPALSLLGRDALWKLSPLKLPNSSVYALCEERPSVAQSWFYPNQTYSELLVYGTFVLWRRCGQPLELWASGCE